MIAWTESDRLIIEHRELAHRFAGKYRGLLERDDLYAAADEGLCRAARTWRPSGADFVSYLHSKVMQCVVDEVRLCHGRRDRPRIKTVAAEEWELDRPAPERNLARVIDLRAALGRLPERTRRMVFAGAAGYSLREIAAAFGVGESRVCQVTVKARKYLEVA
jgi:RNA polymerase sigma factor (sigma-70 family)